MKMVNSGLKGLNDSKVITSIAVSTFLFVLGTRLFAREIRVYLVGSGCVLIKTSSKKNILYLSAL